jgi:hypothetical protein
MACAWRIVALQQMQYLRLPDPPIFKHAKARLECAFRNFAKKGGSNAETV